MEPARVDLLTEVQGWAHNLSRPRQGYKWLVVTNLLNKIEVLFITVKSVIMQGHDVLACPVLNLPRALPSLLRKN